MKCTLGHPAQDRQCRIWDLRANRCEGLMEAPSQSCVAFDQQVGLVPLSCPLFASLVSHCHLLYQS